jgi:hypothetical protein
VGLVATTRALVAPAAPAATTYQVFRAAASDAERKACHGGAKPRINKNPREASV